MTIEAMLEQYKRVHGYTETERFIGELGGLIKFEQNEDGVVAVNARPVQGNKHSLKRGTSYIYLVEIMHNGKERRAKA